MDCPYCGIELEEVGRMGETVVYYLCCEKMQAEIKRQHEIKVLHEAIKRCIPMLPYKGPI